MKLSVSIMLHPSRAQHFDYLVDRLGFVPTAVDRGRGLWDTARRAWKMHDPSAEYHLVVQDDALIASDFQRRAEELLDDTSVATSFYYGRRSALSEEARAGMRAGRVVSTRLRWGVAVCLPVEVIPAMLAFTETLEIPNDDTRISRFLQSRGMNVVYPLPSLVDHRPGPSLVGDDSPGRRAYAFVGED